MQKVIFMGTPMFSKVVLEGLYNNKDYDIICVITKPDSLVGRKQEISITPVKEFALSHDLKVLQPNKLKEIESDIINMKPDLIITAAFGEFVPDSILACSKYKPINCHGSILPKYRGGSPIQTAIKNGETSTGITIMYMEHKMDAGDILAIKEVNIEDNDTSESLFDKLSYVARDLLLETLPKVIDGSINPIKQNEEDASFCHNITKEEELLDFNKLNIEVYNHIRAYYPDPATYFELPDKLVLKVYESKPLDEKTTLNPGTLFVLNKKHLCIACGNNTVLELIKIKPSGKNIINGCDFINGVGRKYL